MQPESSDAVLRDFDTATRHQREVGIDYFDAVALTISARRSSTAAVSGSTEPAQFYGSAGEPAADHGQDDGLVPNQHGSIDDWDAVDRALAAQ